MNDTSSGTYNFLVCPTTFQSICCSGLDIGLGLEVYEAKSFIPTPRPRPRPEDCVLEAPRDQGLVLEDTSLIFILKQVYDMVYLQHDGVNYCRQNNVPVTP